VAPGTLQLDETGYMTIEDFRKAFDQLKIESQTATDIKVLSLGSNTALVTYRLAVKGSFSGQTLPPDVYASTIWKNKGAKWTAVFHQESTAKK